MSTHKYLDKCGFIVFEFGIHQDGRVDVSNGEGEDVVTGVTKEQCKQIEEYLRLVETRVKEYIELHYWDLSA